MRQILSVLMVFLLGSCSLAENQKVEESKDYVGQIHEVELVDYEFEERLNSFYESEPIANQELYDLYEGEFPEGERNPKNLRIHWKDARELALAELELQKPIHTSWNNATVSERPILVLDRDGGDFYRYYEYRVIQDKKFLGAIRIPAYRRTENFATAEVHLYSADEKTYTIHPTGWGQYMAAQINFELNTSIYQTISNQIYQAISDTVAYNFALRYIKNNSDKLPKFDHNSDIFRLQMNKQLSEKYDKDPYIQKLKDQVKLDPKWISESYDKFTKQDKDINFDKINKSLNALAKRIVALKMIESIRKTYTSIQTEGFSIALLGSLQTVFVDMESSPKHSNSIKKALRQLYWKKIEAEQLKMFEAFDISALLDQENIFLELHYFNSPVDTDKVYLSDQELSRRTTPYIAWRYKKEEFKIYGQLPATKARPGADDIVIREELISSFNDAIGDVIDAVGQLGAGTIKGDNAGLTKYIVETIGKLVDLIKKLTGKSFEDSKWNEWSTSIKEKWENIDQGIKENWNGLVCDVMNESSNKAAAEMKKIFDVFKETLYGTKDPATGLYSGGMCDLIPVINNVLTSLTGGDGNPLNGLSPNDGEHIAFLLELCDPNKTEKEVDNKLLLIMYTQMAGYGNEWGIPKKAGITHHLVHYSQNLDWGKKKFFHIKHKFLKPKHLTASEQQRYPLVAEGGYGAYPRKKRNAWKAHASDGW